MRHSELAKKSTNYVKEHILNLTKEEVPDSYRSLLIHWSKFVSTSVKILIIEIMESCVLELERKKKLSKEEHQKNVSTILWSNLNQKLKNNLSFEKRKALKQRKNGDKITMYSFDKSYGFKPLNWKLKSNYKKQLWKAIRDTLKTYCLCNTLFYTTTLSRLFHLFYI